MRPAALFKKFKPLFFDGTGSLVLGKANKLYRMAAGEQKIEFLTVLPAKQLTRLLFRFAWVFRLKRMGFGAGIYFQDRYFFCYDSKIYSYYPDTSDLKCEFLFLNGRGPLSFTVVEGIHGFEDGLYFGEYFGNPKKKSVRIYKKDESGKWNSVFSFPDGEINHIHSIIPDKFRQCVWILTGDFDNSASIWMAKSSFFEVVPILRGKQTYRACVAFPVPEGLFYATDTQISKNSLRLLGLRGTQWISEKIFELNGSCIYGCELKDYYVFSTTTEPTNKKSNFFGSLLDRRPGPGIIENKSDVVAVRKKDLSCFLLFSKKKDFLPYRLFQFGTIQFPSGVPNRNTLFSYSIGNLGNDLSTEVYCLGCDWFLAGCRTFGNEDP